MLAIQSVSQSVSYVSCHRFSNRSAVLDTASFAHGDHKGTHQHKYHHHHHYPSRPPLLSPCGLIRGLLGFDSM